MDYPQKNHLEQFMELRFVIESLQVSVSEAWTLAQQAHNLRSAAAGNQVIQQWIEEHRRALDRLVQIQAAGINQVCQSYQERL